jgi:hypothetical protein
MIVLMLAILLNVVVAIDKTRTLSVQLAGGEGVPLTWSILPGLLLLAAAFLSVAAVVGYGMLYVLRKTGMQRVVNIHRTSDRT